MNLNTRKNKRAQGSGGEAYASTMLLKDGFSVLCRNYVCPGGEVDIIATKEQYLCFQS